MKIHVLIASLSIAASAHATWQPTASRALQTGEIAVNSSGNCDKAGATYVLTQDIVAPTSGLFLGKDVTLDLNGHTLTYAAGYEGFSNSGFEDALNGWDITKAPGAEAKEMQMQHPLVGKKVCVLPQGQEIVSPFINLPVANRAYYAMAAVASHETNIGIYVEDENGKSVQCAVKWDANVRPSCPEIERAPKLGGGVVFALVFGQPAGRYRIRVKAVKGTAVLDEVDIRPALDTGIGIVEKTMPWAYYKCILDGDGTAFFDFTKPGTFSEPVDTIPHVKGIGTVKIRNGTIRLGSKAVRTWGLQSTAKDVRIEIENVKFIASGINTNAISAPSATMRNCRIETDTPWIIDRHRQEDYAVSLMGQAASEVSNCEIIGGQGQLTVRGDNSRIFDNLLVNRQTVVNHYSLGVGGHGTKVFRNRILPEQGSGILIGRQQNLEIYENEIRVAASPPVNEYSNSDYSVNAIRLTDYNAAKGDPKGWCGNNRIYKNRIFVTGRKFAGAHPGYKPMTYGIFMSVGGEQNYIHDNEFSVNQLDAPNDDKHGAYAIYIGGSNQGGTYFNNLIISNDTPIWIGNMYGPGENATFYDNIFRKADGAPSFVPFKLGHYKFPTKNINLFSNRFDGLPFAVSIDDYTTNYTSQFTFGWTLKIKTAPSTEIAIFNNDGHEVLRQKSDAMGFVTARLPEYFAKGNGQFVEQGKRRVAIEKIQAGPYSIRSGNKQKAVTLNSDSEVEL